MVAGERRDPCTLFPCSVCLRLASASAQWKLKLFTGLGTALGIAMIPPRLDWSWLGVMPSALDWDGRVRIRGLGSLGRLEQGGRKKSSVDVSRRISRSAPLVEAWAERGTEARPRRLGAPHVGELRPSTPSLEDFRIIGGASFWSRKGNAGESVESRTVAVVGQQLGISGRFSRPEISEDGARMLVLWSRGCRPIAAHCACGHQICSFPDSRCAPMAPFRPGKRKTPRSPVERVVSGGSGLR